jgi:hypothetical protein
LSADNVIIILQTWSKQINRGTGYYQNVKPYKKYYVFHTQAWDNFEWYKENQPYNVGAYLLTETKQAVVTLDYESAWDHGIKLLKEIGYVEYGMQVVETDYYLYGD